MRYPEAHAAKSGSVPFMLRGPKSVRTVLATAVAGAIGLVPAITVASPASAAPVASPTYTVNSPRVTEGGALVFSISRPALTGTDTYNAETITYTLATGGSAGTATSGSDFTAVTTGTVTFDALSTLGTAQTQTVTVQTLQDTADEADEETVILTLTAGNGGTVPGTMTGTIVDDDNPTYTLTAAPNPVSESLVTANRRATITATLSAPAFAAVTIPVSTLDGTAKAGQDYIPVNGNISIAQGATTGSVTVDVVDDDIDEADIQSFTLNGATAANVAGTQSVTVNIADNDAAPVINLSAGGAATEGSPVTFNATLTGRSEQAVTARWDTSDVATAAANHGIARAGQDYTAVTNGTVTIPALATTATTPISVTTLADTLDEISPEDFQVTLSAPSNATLGATPSAVGGINDSGTALGPQVTLTPTTVTEGGTNATRARTFTVRLSKASGREQRVTYLVGAGTANVPAGIGAASPGQDFTAISPAQTLTFAPGETEKTFTVDVIGDNIDEGNGENIAITLADANTSQLSAGQSLGVNQVTITDDDDKPTISLAQASMTMPEGNGYSAALFQVNLSNPSASPVDWTFAAADPAGTAAEAGSGLGSDDYDVLTTPGSQQIAAGATSGYVLLLVKGDDVYEGDETVRLAVALGGGETDATGGPLTGVLTLTNDDAAPVLIVDSRNAAEGDTVALTGVTSGAAQAATLLNVTATGRSNHGSTAAATGDFSPTTFPVNITAGTPSGTTVPIGSLTIADDTYAEPAETVEIAGTGFGGTGSVRAGWVTIAASDGGTTPTDPGEEPGGEEPGGEEPGEAPKPTINAPARVNGAVAVSITGRVAPNATVELWGAPTGSDSEPVWIMNTKANAQGNYSFSRWIGQGYRFITQSQEVNSNEVVVGVTQAPVFVASSPSRGTISLAVQGNPRGAGQTVIVQRWVNGAWTNAWRGTTGANNQWRGTARVASGTALALRAFVAGDLSKGIYPGYTGVTRFTVR